MIAFTCSTKDLKDAVGKAVKAVPFKAQMPVLECLKIDAEFDRVSFTGYDLITGITSYIEGDDKDGYSKVNVEETDTICVNAKLFYSIIKKLPKGTVHISSDEHLKLTIEQYDICFNLLAMNADDYPEIENVHSAVQTFEIKQSVLQSMLSQTLYARALSESKPILKGAHFSISDDTGDVEIAAIDGFRCAIRKEHIFTDCDFNFTVDGAALEKIQSMLSTESTAVANVTFQKNHIRFKLTGGADCTFTTRLLQGEFYQYKKTASAKYTTSMIIRVSELIEALERAAVLASSPSNLATTLEIDAKERELHIGLSSSKGNFADIVDINEISGEDVRIGFNINFLLDALKAVPDDLAELRFNGNLSPVTIVPIGSDAYTHIVLPVRLKN